MSAGQEFHVRGGGHVLAKIGRDTLKSINYKHLDFHRLTVLKQKYLDSYEFISKRLVERVENRLFL